MTQAIYPGLHVPSAKQLRLPTWLRHLARRDRQDCVAQEISQKQLIEKSLLRREADNEFYTRFGSHRWTPRE